MPTGIVLMKKHCCEGIKYFEGVQNTFQDPESLTTIALGSKMRKQNLIFKKIKKNV
tara:strand:- start:700 stop:867 length:168 start_codon:yes stop_codon:yes gene_type:complete